MDNLKFILFFILLIIQKVTLSDNIYDIEFIKNNISTEYKKGIGAYYIVYSPYRTGYTIITSYIKLPTSLNTNNGKRTAFISFGIQGKYGYIDMGIMNSGNYWTPYYNDNGEFKNFEYFKSNEQVKIIGLQIEIKSRNKIYFAVSLRDAEEKIIGDIFIIEIYYYHIFEYDENDNPTFRFYRFASLVNNKENGIPDNQNDHTYMIDGNFTKLTLRVDNFGESWGISGDFIETGLKISTKKIEVSYMKDYEAFSIKNFDSYSFYLNQKFLLYIFILINLF